MKKLTLALTIVALIFGAVSCNGDVDERLFSYTVSFVSNGGTEVESQIVKRSNCAEKPSNPANGTFAFIGWFLEGSEEKYDFETPITESITLFAHWDEDAYVLNETISTPMNQSQTIEVACTPANITGEGENATTTITFPAGSFGTETTEVTESINVIVYQTPVAAAKFTVNDTEDTIAGLDLTVTVDDVPVSTFNDKVVIVTTYIAKNLTNVGIQCGDDTWTSVGTEDAVDEGREFYYNNGTGELVFATTHFSQFLVSADEVAYIESSNTAYKTLGEAIDAAEGKEIIIIKDIDTTKDGFTIASGKVAVIDLNGRKIYTDHAASGNTYVLKNQGTLTINDSSKDGKGQISIDNGCGYRNDYVLYLEGGSTTTINGGKIITQGYYPVYVVNSNDTLGKTTFIMNNGYVSGGYYGLYLNGGNSETSALDAKINGGTIKTTFYVNQLRTWYKADYIFDPMPPTEVLLYYTKEYEAMGCSIQTYYFVNLTIKNAVVGYDGPSVTDEYIDEQLANAPALSDYYINKFGQQPTAENTKKIITIEASPISFNVNSPQVAKISIVNTILDSYCRENDKISSDSKSTFDPADYQDWFSEMYPGTTHDGDVWTIKK